MKIIYKILAVLSLTLASSCESFIDLKPRDQITSDDYWETSSDLESYVLHFYPELPGGEMITQDENTDNMITTIPSKVMDGERTPTTGNWVGEWSPIRDVNIFLNNYSKCQEPFENYKQYVGEAYFFRAWFYFGLLKKYGDLPWINKPLEMGSSELMNSRDSRSLIADSILGDIDKAISDLPLRSDVGNSRLNRETALAFKTRVALYEGTWEKYHANTPFDVKDPNPQKYFNEVVDAATELMNGQYTVGIYSTGNPDNDYFDLFGLSDMSNIKEVLFYKAFNKDEGLQNNVQYMAVRDPSGLGATWSLVTSYLGNDGKPIDYLHLAKTYKGNNFLKEIAAKADPRLKQSIWMPGDLTCATSNATYQKPPIDQGALLQCTTGFQIKKSANPTTLSACAGDAETKSETGFIYFRYAEVLLNYAEAKYELDKTIAYDQLNLLRERVGMPDFSVISRSEMVAPLDYGYSISDALYAIRRERRVELAFEGLRESDYMRWAAASLFKGKRPKGYPFELSEFPSFAPHIDENGLIDFFQNELPSGYGFRDNQDYLYPIPQDELTLNSNLKQNPGWK